MRRIEPAASVALPPISPLEVTSDSAGWTVTERRPPVGNGVSAPKSYRKTASASPRIKARTDTAATGGPAGGAAGGAGAGGGGGGRGGGGGGGGDAIPQADRELLDAVIAAANGGPGAADEVTDLNAALDLDGTSPKAPHSARQPNLMKGRAIESWLNHTLCQAGKPLDSTVVGSTAAKQTQGLAQFGVDSAALEKLGLDPQQAERVYRAMFVYSQGLHAVLQEAAGRAKSSSAALLVLWRAFTAVMEHVGQSEEKGESLAALVQRGNEEERARIEGQYKDQVASLQGQTQRLVSQRRALQEEVARLREDEGRLKSESDMYRTEHEACMSKYEKEIKLRVDAEVRFLDKTRWAESLQESLDKERQEGVVLRQQLKQEVAAKESALVELESMRTQVKVLESQVTTYKQGIAEAAQQKQRHEQQVGQLKQQLDRHDRKMQEVKDQLDQEQETSKRLQELSATQQRELRKLERQCEDESHARRDLQNERDTLREKLEKADKDIAEMADERRQNQKKFNDLSMAYRTNQIDLRRKTDGCDRAEQSLEKLTQEHKQLVEHHREITNEVESLRDEVKHQEAQLVKESDLRKQLQSEKKQQAGQMQTLTVQLDSTKLNLQNTQKELAAVTEAKVKQESIVRDTRSAMQKSNLEHQVELKANIQKIAMLEKVIADERNERRNLVAETQEVVGKREETYERLKLAEFEIRDLKRQRLEKEEEVDRYKVLLKAQEQRNSEQLVIVDKYHAAVANHNAETREMQVLLESERVEAKSKLQKLQDAYVSQRTMLEQRIEHWKLSYEDALSQLNFNPLSGKIHIMESTIEELNDVVKQKVAEIESQKKKAKSWEDRLARKDKELKTVQDNITKVEAVRDEWKAKFEQTLIQFERAAMAQGDAEHNCERIKKNTEAFDEMKAELEAKLLEATRKYEALVKTLEKSTEDKETQVIIHTGEMDVQTDLSYQYLEQSSRLTQENGRREKLDALMKASHFVEDEEERRDFPEHMRPGAMSLGQVEYRFDEGVHTAKGAACLHFAKPPPGVGAGITVKGSLGGPGARTLITGAGPPAAPEPYPRRPVPPAGRPRLGRTGG